MPFRQLFGAIFRSTGPSPTAIIQMFGSGPINPPFLYFLPTFTGPGLLAAGQTQIDASLAVAQGFPGATVNHIFELDQNSAPFPTFPLPTAIANVPIGVDFIMVGDYTIPPFIPGNSLVGFFQRIA